MRVGLVALLGLVLAGCAVHPGPEAMLPSSTGSASVIKQFDVRVQAITGQERVPDGLYRQRLQDYRTQPDFNCRHPVYWRFFMELGESGRATQFCEESVPFAVDTIYEGRQVVYVAPQRIHAIHLLFAGNSTSMASRFGHVAVRLVVCPRDHSSAEECDANLFEHIVLGFRAHVDELSLDTLKALRGQYRAHFYAYRFMDVYQEYAIGEFRDVYSLPLVLTDVQQRIMVRELADVHWRYSGQYRFFTRNCATLLQDVLRTLWTDYAGTRGLERRYLRPDKWFQAVQKTDRVDGSKLSSLLRAEQDGFYFPNTRSFYEQALYSVQDAAQTPWFSTLDEYLAVSPLRRRQWFGTDAQLGARLVQEQSLRDAVLMLEEYAAMRAERWFTIAGVKYLGAAGLARQPERTLAQLDDRHRQVFQRCLWHDVQQVVAPRTMRNAVPRADEVRSEDSREAYCLAPAHRQLLSEAIEQLSDARSKAWRDLRASAQVWAESMTNVRLLTEL